MKLEEFTPDVAKRLMYLWKRHMGIYGMGSSYLKNPELLSELVRDRENWITGRYEDRIGSKYTDDSKLIVCLNRGEVEVSCYAQAHAVMGRERAKEAEQAEKNFNLAVKTLL